MNNQIYLDTLKSFFGALGNKKFEIDRNENNKLFGKVFYEDNEIQEICWDYSKYKPLSANARNIADLLAENELIDIDQITITRNELFELYKQKYGEQIKFNEFENYLEELENIQIGMVNDNETTDHFFIHE